MYSSVFSPGAPTGATSGGRIGSYDDVSQALFTVLAVIAVLCVLLVVLTYLEPDSGRLSGRGRFRRDASQPLPMSLCAPSRLAWTSHAELSQHSPPRRLRSASGPDN